jgi:hypothetical protein
LFVIVSVLPNAARQRRAAWRGPCSFSARGVTRECVRWTRWLDRVARWSTITLDQVWDNNLTAPTHRSLTSISLALFVVVHEPPPAGDTRRAIEMMSDFVNERA